MKFSEGTGESAMRLSIRSCPTWAMESDRGPWRSSSSALRSVGESIGIQDTIIVGMALRHGETLVTRNTQHYGRVRDLAIKTW